MKPFTPILDGNSRSSLYIQLYNHIKRAIVSGDLSPGEKLPSLRVMANNCGVSVTTSSLAYEQLLTEGYIESRARSGYFVMNIPEISNPGSDDGERRLDLDLSDDLLSQSNYIYDLESFDFLKWKKCSARVYNEFPHLLLTESDVQGEAALRFEICKYLFSSRGVTANPDQVVIGAGTQQLTTHLSRILARMDIDLICTEDPGYIPIQNIFRDRGFGISMIPVGDEGIEIDRLPINIPSAVYVSPANQFPTGAVMPAAARYRLLNWAEANNSIILEDDYDSELRYFGKPIPALKGLDTVDSVVYLGSFSSTLFPAIKISYMILPQRMAEIFEEIKSDYTQTCSKAEQLTLALFMEDGYYYTNIRKLRNLYSQKLVRAVESINKYGAGLITPINTQSGINMTLEVHSGLSSSELCRRAKEFSIHCSPLTYKENRKNKYLIFYFSQIPLSRMDELIKKMARSWKK